MKRELDEKSSDAWITVNSCRERVLQGGAFATRRPRGRVDYGIQYIREGCGFCEQDGTVTEVPAGSLMLQYPGNYQHYFFPADRRTVLVWAHFSGTLCRRLDELGKENRIIRIDNRTEFERAFSAMIRAELLGGEEREILCAGYMQTLVGMILRSVSGDSRRRVHDGLDRVINHMWTHCAEPICLSDYAAMCFVSQDRFVHVFKAYTGVSPYRFQLQIRLRQAREMLEETSESVAQIAETMGFHDPSYFCRVFKKFTGQTPLSVRKKE